MPKPDVVLKIVETMQQSGKPLILNHISKRTKIPVQLVDYHLEKMIDAGIVCTLEENGSKYYMLQAIFYDKNWLDALYNLLTPFVEEMKNNISFEESGVPDEKAVINILTVFLDRFEVEVGRLFKNSLKSP